MMISVVPQANGLPYRKEPGRDHTKNKEVQSLCHYRHLKEAGEDREMHDGFRSLAVVGGA
jgi:hypothetical protein